MFDANDFVKLINQAAIGAYNSMKPLEVLYGTVSSAAPLNITIDQKTTLIQEQLVLTRNVTDYDVNMTVNHNTETAEGHSHGYAGTKTFTVINALQEGEKVVLLKIQGGQEYLVWDRVV